MRWLFVFLIFNSFLFGEISYSGMTIECDRGCGEIDDPDFEKILRIFAKTIDSVFSNCSILDESLESRLINPWGDGGGDEWNYWVWDWKSAKGLWPSTTALGKLATDPPRKQFSIYSYPKFLETAFALKEDVYFYYCQAPRLKISTYNSLVQKLRAIDRNEYASVDIYNGGDFELFGYGSTTSTCKDINELIKNIKSQIKREEAGLSYYQTKYEEKSACIEKTIEEIDALFKHIFVWCLRRHQVEGVTFEAAVENFIAGDYDKAIEQIQLLISLSEKHKFGDQLISKLYLLQGQVQSEFCLYADAVVGLTTAIQKDPSQKEAYFERAVAYFELGEFDKSVEDYIQSDFSLRKGIQLTSILPIGAGVAAGIIEGVEQAAIEFIPEALSSLRGMGNGLWAFSADPVGVSNDFIDAAIQCIEFLRIHSPFQFAQNIVSELKELVQNSDPLVGYQKGKQVGQIIGKYGTDILICKYSITAIKAYRDLKRANQLMTLESLASSNNAKIILEEAGKRWSLNEQILINSNAELKGNCLNNLWHRGTFESNTESLLYHLKKHGKGRSAIQYTKDAMSFFETHKELGTQIILRDGSKGIKIQIKNIGNDGSILKKIGGYWTEDGKLVTFWD